MRKQLLLLLLCTVVMVISSTMIGCENKGETLPSTKTPAPKPEK